MPYPCTVMDSLLGSKAQAQAAVGPPQPSNASVRAAACC
jgi:hypothetical protein